METTSSILVFKTNIQSPDDLNLLKPLLDDHPHIVRWNVDMEDIDCVLQELQVHFAACSTIMFVLVSNANSLSLYVLRFKPPDNSTTTVINPDACTKVIIII